MREELALTACEEQLSRWLAWTCLTLTVWSFVAGCGSPGSSPHDTTDGGHDTGSATTGGADSIIEGLDGFLYTGECREGVGSEECALNCAGSSLTERAPFAIEGEEHTVYDVTLHVYGVVELRHDYSGGTRRQGDLDNAASERDFWYDGGSYTPEDGFNVYGLRVTPPVEGVHVVDAGGNNYFLNARDASDDAQEVWELNYDATFPVPGGGSLSFTAYSPHCRQVINAAETARPSGNDPIVVPDVEQADPPPIGFEQPFVTNGLGGQWIFFDVVRIAAR